MAHRFVLRVRHGSEISERAIGQVRRAHRWATDVTVSKFSSIQTPERVTDANGNGTGPTVNFIRNPVIKPRANPASTFEAPQMAQDANPQLDTYDLTNVQVARNWAPVVYTAKTAGTF